MKTLEKEKMHALLDAVIDAGKQGEGEGAAPYACFAIGPGHLAISVDDGQGRDFWENRNVRESNDRYGACLAPSPGLPPDSWEAPSPGRKHEPSPGDGAVTCIVCLMFFILGFTALGVFFYACFFTVKPEVFVLSVVVFPVDALIFFLLPRFLEDL